MSIKSIKPATGEKGCMGEVGRAPDTKVGPDVAIEPLPEAFARAAPAGLSSCDRRYFRLLEPWNCPTLTPSS